MKQKQLGGTGYSLQKHAEKAEVHKLGARYGNASNVPKAETARKLKQKEKEKESIGHESRGAYEDLKTLRKEFNEKYIFRGDTRGYLRDIGEDPFKAGMWRREQLRTSVKAIVGAKKNGLSIMAPLVLWPKLVKEIVLFCEFLAEEENLASTWRKETKEVIGMRKDLRTEQRNKKHKQQHTHYNQRLQH